MADPPERTPHTREIPRFEEVLLCAPAGDQPVAFIRTIKWTETGLMKRGQKQASFQKWPDTIFVPGDYHG